MRVESLAADRLEYLEDVDASALHSHFTDAVEIDGPKNPAWGKSGRSLGDLLENFEVLVCGVHKSGCVDQDEGLGGAVDFRLNLVDLAVSRALARESLLVSWTSSWCGWRSNRYVLISRVGIAVTYRASRRWRLGLFPWSEI